METLNFPAGTDRRAGAFRGSADRNSTTVSLRRRLSILSAVGRSKADRFLLNLARNPLAPLESESAAMESEQIDQALMVKLSLIPSVERNSLPQCSMLCIRLKSCSRPVKPVSGDWEYTSHAHRAILPHGTRNETRCISPGGGSMVLPSMGDSSTGLGMCNEEPDVFLLNHHPYNKYSE
ncbi:hypothetical protein Dimus_021185 [Dionaea muscipula]